MLYTIEILQMLVALKSLHVLIAKIHFLSLSVFDFECILRSDSKCSSPYHNAHVSQLNSG